MGATVGWRAAVGLVVGVGVITVTAVWFWLPFQLRFMPSTSPMTELGALRRVQSSLPEGLLVWVRRDLPREPGEEELDRRDLMRVGLL